MSSPSPSLSPTPDISPDTVFTISLTVSSLSKKTIKNKTTSKEERSVKTKELMFTTTETNYLTFLHAALAKHSCEQFKISDAKCYPYKYTIGTKRFAVSDAMDVDNSGDYMKMSKKTNDKRPTDLKIFINMKDVEKLPCVTKLDGEGEPDGTDDEHLELALKGGITNLDLQLACWNDGRFTYIGPLGALTLTPAMILDWCRALEAGKATLFTPPNITSFDVAHKATALHRAHRAGSLGQPLAPIPLPSPAINFNALTSVLLLQTLKKITPTLVSTHGTSAIDQLSPIIWTPSQLSHFLKHAEKHLGVSNATTFEAALQLQDIGPDILSDVSDQTLRDIGMSMGDVIRLKKGSATWWNGPDAKHKYSETNADSNPSKPVTRKITYEK
ncbi:hypothetical protein PAXRUDRAFT_791188, partial [Paxillus rubicundulus Ve08.2h10]